MDNEKGGAGRMSIQTMRFSLRHAAPWPAQGKIHDVELNLLNIRYDEGKESLWVDSWLERIFKIAMPDGRLRCYRDQINLQGRTDNALDCFPQFVQVILENLVYTPRSSPESTEVEMEIHLQLTFPQNNAVNRVILPPHEEIKIWAPCRINEGSFQNVIFWELGNINMNQVKSNNFRVEGSIVQWEHGGIFTGHLYWREDLPLEEKSHPFTLVMPVASNNNEAVFHGEIRLVNVDPVEMEPERIGAAVLVELVWWVTVSQEFWLKVAKNAPEIEGVRLKSLFERKEIEVYRTVPLPCQIAADQVIELTCSSSETESSRSEHGFLYYGDWIVSIYYLGTDNQEHHIGMSVPWNCWYDTSDDAMITDFELRCAPVKAEVKSAELCLSMTASFFLFRSGIYSPLSSNDGDTQTIAVERLLCDARVDVCETIELLPEIHNEAIIAVRWKAVVEKAQAFSGWISAKTCLHGEIDYRDNTGKILSFPIHRGFFHTINSPQARRGNSVKIKLNLEYQSTNAEKSPENGYVLLFQYEYLLWQEIFLPVTVIKKEPLNISFVNATETPNDISIVWEEPLPTTIRRIVSAKYWLSQCREDIRASERFVEGEIRALIEWEDHEGYLRRNDVVHSFWRIWKQNPDDHGMTVIRRGECEISPRWFWGSGQLKFSIVLGWIQLPEEMKEEWGVGSSHLIRRRRAAFAPIDSDEAQTIVEDRVSNDVRAPNRLDSTVSSRKHSSVPGEKL